MTEEQWLPMLLAAIAALVPSLLNTIISSDSWYGKVISAFALAVGKARVDPTKQ
jgi:hypothetical protein